MTNQEKVLIISEEKDISTFKVISYLIKNNTKFVRLNENDTIEEVVVDLKKNMSFSIRKKSQTIQSNSITTVWLRRGQIRFAKGEMLSDEKLIME